mmetsp:Transcript_8246/g.18007  ORF Transcript_8246/g.18007 Transcript_8246/m.18007 type:complete len:115 (-) Transcript_8246:105-449(-)|eukprot:CAMPEP_0170606110 /NCGR_PEP_ID=MMETSP0224-20130122/20331_1 /TAXON_ID=285029 /ORGANISM="Togula jolla, Strain CCCM 725" /LENGTH=114 /DNA_ID=CAMNT_0010931157 /DNA_START=52 /DNA_END=396 /DNA_ORIENTATION=-
MSKTGTVKKFFEDKGFGFIAPDDGGEDVFIHIKECVDTEALYVGDQVSYDTTWDDRKGKFKGSNCSQTSGGGGGGGAPRGGGYGYDKGGMDKGKGKGGDRFSPYGGKGGGKDYY